MKMWKTVWNKLRGWKYWKPLLFPHPLLVIGLSLLSGLSLIWVFTNGFDFSMVAYLLYVLSTYSLTVLILLFLKRLPWLKFHFQRDPFVRKVLSSDGAIGISLYVEQCINFWHGGYKILSGIRIASAWIGADGIYNFTQGTIQLYQILRHRTVTEREKQWKVYRTCGYLIIGMHMTMIGMMFQMIQMGRHESATEISIIATAAFTFYKLISGFVEMATDRKHRNPVDSAVIFLNFAQALYNLFVLQVGLLWLFGGTDYQYQKLMNTLTGMAVCVLVLGMGIYMIRRANRNIKSKSTA